MMKYLSRNQKKSRYKIQIQGSTRDHEQPTNDTNAVELDLPTTFAKRSDGAACRDTLDQLRGLTFNIVDRETLKDMNKQLSQLLQETRSKLDKEDNLIKQWEENVAETKKCCKLKAKKQ